MDNFDDVPDVVTKDRSNIHKIIEEMLESPDENGIYSTTRAFNKLEKLMESIRLEAVVWAWASIAVPLDEAGKLLVNKAQEELNPPWKSKK